LAVSKRDLVRGFDDWIKVAAPGAGQYNLCNVSYATSKEAVKNLRFHFGTSTLRSQNVTSRSSPLFAGERRISVFNRKTKP
jgi:hypothetical protein